MKKFYNEYLYKMDPNISELFLIYFSHPINLSKISKLQSMHYGFDMI